MHLEIMAWIRGSRFAMSMLLIPTLVLAGCIMVPVPLSTKAEEPHISEQELQPFTIGDTTRDDVQATLGKPDVTRRDNQLWIYGWNQYHGKSMMVSVVPLISPTPFVDNLYETFHVLFIEFDATGVLRNIVLEDLGDTGLDTVHEACRQDGICVRHWKLTQDPDDTTESIGRLNDSVTIVTASYTKDSNAKNFVPGEDTCGVYLYTKKDKVRFSLIIESYLDQDKIWFSFGGLIDSPLDDKTYAFFESTPGIKELHLATDPDHSHRYFSLKRFDCPAGKNVYVSMHLSWPFGFKPTKPQWTVRLETPAVGQEKIKDRRLQLLKSN